MINMENNIETSKKPHPFRMAEEYAKNPVKSLSVQPLEVNPFMIAQLMKPTKRHPFLASCVEAN